MEPVVILQGDDSAILVSWRILDSKQEMKTCKIRQLIRVTKNIEFPIRPPIYTYPIEPLDLKLCFQSLVD